jgi:flavin-dependent dehydrogenase
MIAGQLAAEVCAHAVDEEDASVTTLREYERRWAESRGRKMQRNYRLKMRFSAADRCSHAFQRAFAVSLAGK